MPGSSVWLLWNARDNPERPPTLVGVYSDRQTLREDAHQIRKADRRARLWSKQEEVKEPS